MVQLLINKTNQQWYELDGIIIRKSRRHHHAMKIRTWNDLPLSDHKPISLKPKITQRKWQRVERRPLSVDWERMQNPEVAKELTVTTAEAISKALVQTAIDL